MATTPGIKLVCTHPGCEKRSAARRLCSAHYQAAWKAGELGQHVKLPPREKARTRCPEGHKHEAASTCYIQHQCRCQPCCDAHAARERNRQKQNAYGRFDTGLVDADPVRAHVLALSDYGIGYKRVAELAGVGVTGVRQLVWGRQEPGPRNGEVPKRITREKAERIMAVQPTIENLGARQPVPATGTHRRIRALVTRGWSLSRIAGMLGMEIGNFWALLQRTHVGAATHLRMVEIYEAHWNVTAPRSTWHEKAAYTRSVKYAAKRGWLPPLAWDDIDTDPEPETTVVQQGRVTGEELLEEIAFLLEGGESAEQVAVLVGRKVGTIAKLAERYGDRGIANTFGAIGKRVAA